MPVFTHGKRTYLTCERHRMDFKITVKHINFRTNAYFLANSHYVIFRKENKNKKFKSKNKCLKAEDLKHVPIDEKVKFRACLLQDLQHKYLERYIVKEKRFVLRQVTEVPGEELYVDCGHFNLPLHVYGMLPSGQNLTVELKDPNGMATGTVELVIEHEPQVLIGNVFPDFWANIRRLLYKEPEKSPLPPNILSTNRDKLDFLKKKQLDHHHSRYDLSDDEDCSDNDEETRSESDLGDDPGQFGSFKFGNSRKEAPSANDAGGSTKRQDSLELHAGMFNLDDLPPTPGQQIDTNKCASGSSKNSNDTPRSTDESVSTITVSAKDHFTPRGASRPASFRAGLPEVPEGADSTTGEESCVETAMGCNRVPFASSSAAAQGPSEQAAATPEAEEEWEQPPDEWLATPALPSAATAAPAPKPVPVPPRGVTRANSESARSGSEDEQPSLERKPSFNHPAPPRKSLRNPPPPLPLGGTSNYMPARAVTRTNSAPQMPLSARALLSMSSTDEQEYVDTARSAHSTSSGAAQIVPPVRPAVSPMPSPVPPQGVTRQKTIKVPVRLTSNIEVNAAHASRPAMPVPPTHPAHPTADLRQEQQHQQVSVRELRRNFERPPLHKETSSSASHSSHSSEDAGNGGPPRYVGLAQGVLPPPPPLQRHISRADSEKSYSTLSTHDPLPARPPPGKILMPVRMKSPQEIAYGSGPAQTGISYHAQDRHQEQHHQLHRTATAPTLTVPLRMAPPTGDRHAEYRSPHRAEHSQPTHPGHRRTHSGSGPMPPPLPPMSAEKAGGHGQHIDHHLHRTATAPNLGQAHDYARSLQAAAYGGNTSSATYRHPSPSVVDPRREHSHGRPGPSHIIAPPIRLQASDRVPDRYEPYTHLPGETHHRHHHSETTEQYRGEYLREIAYEGGVGAGPRRTHSVYA
jgi:hypothetical protein